MADKTLSQLIINKLSKAQYDAMSSHSEDELWFVTGSGSDIPVTPHNHDDLYLKLTGGDINGNVHITGSLTNGGSTNGQYVIASGQYSHAEGAGSISVGVSSHAEGRETKAIGDYSHAEGYATTASGLYSHAEGDHTIATQENQLVIGQYNDTSSKLNNYLFVVGNGSYESSQSYQPSVRSNAFAVDKWGNIDIPLQAMLRGTASCATSINSPDYQADSDKVEYREIGASIALTSLSNYNTPNSTGFEKHWIIKNTGSSTITMVLPTISPYVCVSDETIDIETGKIGEVNVANVNNTLYVRGIGN